MLQCPICSLSAFPNLKKLLRHIRITHADNEAFNIQCNLQGCRRTFRRLRTYENHIYGYHDVTALENGELQESEQAWDGLENRDGSIVNGGEESITDVPSVSQQDYQLNEWHAEEDQDDGPPQLQRAAATWILKTREVHRIPLSVMDYIIQDVQSLFDIVVNKLSHHVIGCLKEEEVEESIVDLVRERFLNHSCIFDGLQTQHQLLSYIRRNFNFVNPIKIVLGTNRVARGSGAKRRLVELKDTFVYVPILDTLQSLLMDDTVLSEVERGHQNTASDALCDFCDGSNFSTHPLFSVCKNSLQIMLYYDDVEICNPLGSHTKIHKLGVFYFLLGNLPPKHRSKLRVIQLVALCRHRFIKRYGIHNVLSPIVEDLKKLESGYLFELHGAPRTYHGTLAVVSADNPASNALGGFKESCSAHRHCRQCLGTKEEARQEFREDFFELRSLAKHQEHCMHLETNNDVEYSKEVGVNCRSALLQLEHFDLCSGALLPDVMHDLLEGVLMHVLEQLLGYCIAGQRYFPLSHLNQRLREVELGFMETSRPSQIDHWKNIRQNASQSWALGRILPLLIGGKVPEGDLNWEHYLSLLQIMNLIMAPNILPEDVALLEVLLTDFLKYFKEIYPNASVIPKLHYLIHVPRLILKFGPLVRHWTMRYEAKHNYLKKLAQNVGNYLNISWTLSMRHQYLQCYYHLKGDGLFDCSPEIGPGDTVAIRDLPPELQDEDCYRANWVKLDGVIYKVPCALTLGVQNDYPHYGKLLNVYVVGSRFIFHVVELNTIIFNVHYNVYVVSSTSVTKFLLPCQLHSPFPSHIHQISINSVTSSVIVPKYRECGTLL